MRLFIAIPIDDALKKSLVELQKQIKLTQADVRFVHPENIHLTLRFLGEMDEKSVPSIRDILKKAVSGYQAFEVELKGIGAFPSGSIPRVIWVGYQELSNTNNTKQVYEDIENGLLALGLVPDDHSFSPHITLARIKSSKNRDKLTSLVKEKSNFCFGKQTIKKINLFQSQLHPTGPVYSVIDSFALQEK